MSEKTLLKNRAQAFNPVTKHWIKIDTANGRIVAHKKTFGPYSNIRKLIPKKDR